MTRALHWIVTTLKNSGFGSGAGALTLGEYMISQELPPTVCVVLSLGVGLGGEAAIEVSLKEDFGWSCPHAPGGGQPSPPPVS